MFKAAVRDGDSTTTGGQVFGSGFPADGRNVALDGDKATCGECPGKHLIRGSRHGAIVNGRAMVQEGDDVTCPCGKNRVAASFSGIVFEEATTRQHKYDHGPCLNRTFYGKDSISMCDEVYVLRSQASGHPLPNVYYRLISENGVIAQGITDQAGRTQRFKTNVAERITVEIGDIE